MTPLGLLFMVVGGLGLGAGLTGLLLERLDHAAVDDKATGQVQRLRRHASTSIFASAPVLMTGLLLVDARPIPDVVGVLLLAAVPLGLVGSIGLRAARVTRGT